MNVAVEVPKLPPMLTQYLEYKKQYPDCQLFFQVGDFYELFFEDAVLVSKTLNLTLTTRDKNDPNPVPMCGVPIGVADGYVDRLVALGLSVAVVSQVGVPTGKGMVERKLERIVTPGIRLLGRAEEGSASIVASCVVESDAEAAIAFSEVQTGTMWVREGLTASQLAQELSRICPTEMILPRSIQSKPIDRRLPWVREIERVQTAQSLKFRPESYVESGRGGLRDFAALPGYAVLAPLTKKAVRLLVNYIDETTIDKQVCISQISARTYTHSLLIDATTRRNLELVTNTRDSGLEGTLFAHLNLTQTSAGARLLREWILQPLCELSAIQRRHTIVAAFAHADELRRNIREELTFCADIERIAARIELAAASPKELGALRDTLERVPRIQQSVSAISLPNELQHLIQALESDTDSLSELQRLLTDNPPHIVSDGGIIRAGVDVELDKLRELKASGKAWILELEASERERSGISSLKIKYNNILGYFIEVTRTNLEKVPDNYIRRQSTVNGERYTTVELKQREQEVMGAEDKALALERNYFEALRSLLRKSQLYFRRVALALAELDVLLSFAELKVKEAYVTPQVDESTELEIVEGSHPVLASKLRQAFVANSIELKAETPRCLVLTGPNMGGKSTYIRQTGLIVIMAHMGAPVPAKAARMGLVDRLFARIGASDNIAEGESTFMVEMREASYILAAATQRSLLLVDEIGRGTATADGLALAQAILEQMVHALQCRSIFATHFHELTQLESVYPAVKNISVGSVDREGEVFFTHRILDGAAKRSYGLEVAKLAGIPADVLKRARYLLSQRSMQPSVQEPTPQLSLFSVAKVSEPVMSVPDDYEACKAVVREIQDSALDDLSPRECQTLLYSLSQKVKELLP
jgi:DNA mismatch repair protein MutS